MQLRSAPSSLSSTRTWSLRRPWLLAGWYPSFWHNLPDTLSAKIKIKSLRGWWTDRSITISRELLGTGGGCLLVGLRWLIDLCGGRVPRYILDVGNRLPPSNPRGFPCQAPNDKGAYEVATKHDRSIRRVGSGVDDEWLADVDQDGNNTEIVDRGTLWMYLD